MLLLLNFQGSEWTEKFATKSKEKTFKLLLKCDSKLLKSFGTLGSNDVKHYQKSCLLNFLFVYKQTLHVLVKTAQLNISGV
jgi:hypothetical protein